MDSFLQRFGRLVVGKLCGVDQLRFRGSKRQMCYVTGMMSWLGAMHILLKEYKLWVRDVSVAVCKAIETPAEQFYAPRRLSYVPSTVTFAFRFCTS